MTKNLSSSFYFRRLLLMDQIIINDNTIDYIWDCLTEYTQHLTEIYHYDDIYGRKYIFSHNENSYEELQKFLNGKTMDEVSDLIDGLNISDLYKKIIQNYLSKIISNFKIDNLTKQVDNLTKITDELTKLVYCQNDKMNILIDALDLANQNVANAKK